MKTTILGNDNCPNCNKLIDRVTGIQDEAIPVPGDLSICIDCGYILRFSKDMAVEIMPACEFLDFPLEKRLMILEIQSLIRNEKPKN